MPNRTTIRLLLGLALAASAAVPAVAGRSAVGSAGELYRVVQVRLGDLSSAVAADQRDNPALAIEIRRVGQPTNRVLVPRTDDVTAEDFETAVFEPASKSLFVVWQGRINIHPVVFFARYTEGSWEEPVYLTRNVFTPKYAPQLVITRDLSGADPRIVAHVVWAEEAGPGQVETFYMPLVLTNGRPAEASSPLRLNDFDTSTPASVSFELNGELLKSPRLRPGADDQSVVVAFANPATRKIVSLEIGVVPEATSKLAAEARAHIVIMTARTYGTPGSADRKAAANSTRDSVVSGAKFMTPEIARTVGDEIRALLLADPGTGELAVQRMAGEARAHIVIMTSRIRSQGLSKSVSGVGSDTLVRFGDAAAADALELRLAVNASPVAVRTGEAESTRIHSSEDGRRLAVSWSNTERLRYREWSSTGWSEPYDITLSPDFTVAEAAKAVDERVNGR